MSSIHIFETYFTNIFFVCFAIFQAGGFPEPEIVHYNPKDFDFGKKKSFPFRDQVKQQHKIR